MNTIADILSDKSIKNKEKKEILSILFLNNEIHIHEYITSFNLLKPAQKASLMEVAEYISQKKPEWVTQEIFDLAIKGLMADEPRMKWESARVIGNCIHLFQAKIKDLYIPLLQNTTHPGTVVRWSTAYALGNIVMLKTEHNDYLIADIKNILASEEQSSIRKIYEKALKKSGNSLT